MPRAIVCPFCHEYIEDASGLDAGRLACPACAEEITPAQVEHQSAEWVAARRSELEKQGRVRQVMPTSGNPTPPVINPNLRWKDNLFQVIAIGVCAVSGGALSGSLGVDPLEGGFLGVLVGLFVSGITLLVIRKSRR